MTDALPPGLADLTVPEIAERCRAAAIPIQANLPGHTLLLNGAADLLLILDAERVRLQADNERLRSIEEAVRELENNGWERCVDRRCGNCSTCRLRAALGVRSPEPPPALHQDPTVLTAESAPIYDAMTRNSRSGVASEPPEERPERPTRWSPAAAGRSTDPTEDKA